MDQVDGRVPTLVTMAEQQGGGSLDRNGKRRDDSGLNALPVRGDWQGQSNAVDAKAFSPELNAAAHNSWPGETRLIFLENIFQ